MHTLSTPSGLDSTGAQGFAVYLGHAHSLYCLCQWRTGTGRKRQQTCGDVSTAPRVLEAYPAVRSSCVRLPGMSCTSRVQVLVPLASTTNGGAGFLSGAP